jgi:peptidoglycan/LPS O-acetylase OafA/YrhL
VKPNRRIPILDGLRALSIALVLAAHMLPLGVKKLQLNYVSGAMGMSLFFSLSGFLITTALLDNPDVGEFLIKRAMRIVPLSYAYSAVICLFFVFAPVSMLVSMAFLLNYWPEYMVPGLTNHLWSLCVEVHFYLAIALTVLLFGKRALWLVWPACVTVTLLRIHEGAYISILTHQRVDEILIGACVATLWNRSIGTWIRVSGPVLCIFIVFWAAASGPYISWLQYLRPYACGMVLFGALVLERGRVRQGLESKPLRYIAEISYALYVVHPLTMDGWFNQGSVAVRYFVKRPISFLMTFALAHLSTFYWEKLWMSTGRRWIKARRARYAQLTA